MENNLAKWINEISGQQNDMKVEYSKGIIKLDKEKNVSNSNQNREKTNNPIDLETKKNIKSSFAPPNSFDEAEMNANLDDILNNYAAEIFQNENSKEENNFKEIEQPNFSKEYKNNSSKSIDYADNPDELSFHLFKENQSGFKKNQLQNPPKEEPNFTNFFFGNEVDSYGLPIKKGNDLHSESSTVVADLVDSADANSMFGNEIPENFQNNKFQNNKFQNNNFERIPEESVKNDSEAEDINNIAYRNPQYQKRDYDNNFNKPNACSSPNPPSQEFKPSNHQLADLTEWGKPFPWDEEIDNINQRIFGFRKFRPNQREIINANIAGRDIFVCMPTGGGKSLTFQIPAIKQYGVTLVVMPLLSLIQDQTTFLKSIGIKVIFLNSEGTREVLTHYEELFHSEDESEYCKMIFLTPEKVAQSQSTMNFLEKLYREKLLVRLVIDECHCVSQWGREFRPDYLNLKTLKKRFPNLPILAITATAPNLIREDVINQLGMKNTLFFRSSYNRTNLFIEIRNKKEYKDVIANIADFIKNEYPKATGLIYCSSKKNCEKVSQTLKSKYRINCAFYHASLAEKKKNEIQDKWKNDEIKVIVATVAFGMGINKADVRFVIHHSMPKSFEGYYQEIGRAGRDGLYSHCILYYSSSDKKIIEFLMSRTNLNAQMISENLRKTNEMIEYCEEYCECRRVIALKYFDEKFDRNNCNMMCDNCKKGLPCEEKDVTNEALIMLNLLYNCFRENIEMTVSPMIDYLRGTKIKGNKRFPPYDKNGGKLNRVNQFDLRKIFRRLLIMKYIDEHLVVMGDNVYSKIEISNAGMRYIKSQDKKIIIPFLQKNKPVLENEDSKEEKSSKVKDEKANAAFSTASNNGKRPRYNRNFGSSSNNKSFLKVDEDYGLCTEEQFEYLFNELKIRRREILNEENNKLFKETNDGNLKKLSLDDIFTENGLKELCRKLPTDESELNINNIFGISKTILLKYGKYFLYTIQKFIKVYNINKEQKVNESLKKKAEALIGDKGNETNKKDNSNFFEGIDLEELINNNETDKKKEIQSKMNSEKPNSNRRVDPEFENLNKVQDDEFAAFNFADMSGVNESAENEELKMEKNKEFREQAKLLFEESKRNKKRTSKEIDEDDEEEDEEKEKKKKQTAKYFKQKYLWQKINANRKKKKKGGFI